LCEDTYGFSALPGGCGNSDGSFGLVGIGGLWWSALGSNAYNAYVRAMDNIGEFADWGSIVDDGLLSVRCVQD